MFPVFTGIHNILGKTADDPDILRYITATPGFFTVWNLVLHQVYFGCCCLSHVSHAFPKLVPRLLVFVANVVRRNIFNSILVPSSMMTAVNFWGMKSISPAAVYSDMVSAFPQWINHSLHTFVVPISLAELFLRGSAGEAMDFGSRKGWMMINGYVTIYTASTAAHFLSTGTWVYPFYDSMNNWMKAGVPVFMYGSAGLYYFAAKRLGKIFWGKHGVMKQAAPLMAKLK
ncbi:androgen-dependent TFPI-regulating protein-like [Hetaerina americana]|uniref:androgen-dependent TFPI-regulating protein-like n=1 Tax=Hetaerina americana TaxID=62018 RepID=UPI003A7F6095